MNRVGPCSLQQAADGFNPVAIVMLYLRHIGRKCSRGILLTNRVELNVRCFQQHIFHRLIVIGFIRLHLTAFRSIKSEGVERPHLTVRAGSQETLDWLPIFGHQERHFASIKIAVLARNLAAIFLVLVSLGPWNPIMVIDHDWKAVHDIN